MVSCKHGIEILPTNTRRFKQKSKKEFLMKNYEDMTVYETTENEQTEIGSVELPLDAVFAEMPKELEINGYTYHIEA